MLSPALPLFFLKKMSPDVVAAATGLIDPAKISSANGLFEELYCMVYEILCPVPNPPTAMRNILYNFFDTVNNISLDDVEDEEHLEGSYFLSGYRETEAVFYPFQPDDVVEVQGFFDTVRNWVDVVTILKSRAKFVEDEELSEKVTLWKERFDDLYCPTL